MGFGGIGIWQLLIVLAIIVLLFGTKKLRNIGTDLGGAIKGFKKAVTDEDKTKAEAENIAHKTQSDETTADLNNQENKVKDKA